MITGTASNPPLLSTKELEALQWRVMEKWQRNRHKTRAPHAGPFASFFRGQGMEPHDSRPYQPGDDIRHMDWRATARSGRAISKVFLDERGRRLFLIVDRHPGMFFGTRRELKAATAARCAAILAFSALAAREHVAGAIIGDGIRFFPPATTTNGVLPLLYAAAAPAADSSAARNDSLATHLPVLAERIEAGMDLCLISDFHGLTDAHAPLLRNLGGSCAAHALQVWDPGEESLEDAGVLRLCPPGGGAALTVDTHDAALRAHYGRTMTERRQALARLLQRCGVTLTRIATHRDTLGQLEAAHAGY